MNNFVCGRWQNVCATLWFALSLVAAPLTTKALTLGQIDDFQDGTTQHWGVGAGTPPVNVADGGPAGVGDHFLQMTSTGTSGADRRMIIFNASQWLGNYTGAGIGDIAMDLNNLGSQPLSIRIAFFESRSLGFVSTTPVALAANSGWQHVDFPLSAAGFTAIGSPGSFDSLLANFTGQLRILDAASPSLEGDVTAATVGVDNIHAIPEPDAFLLTAAALVALVCWGCASSRN